MIVKTEAVVLKSMRYHETSKIVTFYTQKFGKIRGIAKGARGPKSKFGGALEPITHVSLVIYKRQNREFHTISDCEIIQHFPRIRSDLEKISIAFSVIESLNAVMHDEEKNERVFDLVVDVLSAIDRATKNIQNVLYYYRLHLLDLMGFKPNFQTCVGCRKSLFGNVSDSTLVTLIASKGGFLCVDCSRGSSEKYQLSIATTRILQLLSRISVEKLTTIELSDVSKIEVEEALRNYSRYHLAAEGKLRAERVLKRLAG